jgi:hypothetical protein
MWCTGNSCLSHTAASVLAALSPTARHGAMPGPLVTATASISAKVTPASARARCTTEGSAAEWRCTATLGTIPPVASCESACPTTTLDSTCLHTRSEPVVMWPHDGRGLKTGWLRPQPVVPACVRARVRVRAGECGRGGGAQQTYRCSPPLQLCHHSWSRCPASPWSGGARRSRNEPGTICAPGCAHAVTFSAQAPRSLPLKGPAASDVSTAAAVELGCGIQAGHAPCCLGQCPMPHNAQHENTAMMIIHNPSSCWMFRSGLLLLLLKFHNGWE